MLEEIFKFAAENKRPLRDLGHIDQNDRGSFVVHEHVNYRLYPEDAYLPETLIRLSVGIENADDLIKTLSRKYNRARQSRITSELLDVLGGVEALKG